MTARLIVRYMMFCRPIRLITARLSVYRRQLLIVRYTTFCPIAASNYTALFTRIDTGGEHKHKLP